MSLTNSRPDNSTRIHSKFTRGEKCIFAHLIVTFVLLIVLLIIYFIHLWLVKHNGNQAYATYLRSSDINPEDIRPEYHPVGLVYADTNTFMCNCLLIRYRWSLAPGHCVAARSDPDLADVLPRWRIKYRTRSDSIAANFSETAIKRSLAHPHFNNDDFSNNIGLFQHDVSIPIFSYMFPNQFQLSASSLKTFKDDLELIGWEESWQPPDGHILETSVRPVTLEKCTRYVSPIVDLRNYEYCVKPAVRRNATIVGSIYLADEEHSFYLSRLDKKTTPEKVFEHVREAVKARLQGAQLELSIIPLESQRANNFSSFRLKVPAKHQQMFLCSDFWPEGVVFRRFRVATKTTFKNP